MEKIYVIGINVLENNEFNGILYFEMFERKTNKDSELITRLVVKKPGFAGTTI